MPERRRRLLDLRFADLWPMLRCSTSHIFPKGSGRGGGREAAAAARESKETVQMASFAATMCRWRKQIALPKFPYLVRAS